MDAVVLATERLVVRDENSEEEMVRRVVILRDEREQAEREYRERLREEMRDQAERERWNAMSSYLHAEYRAKWEHLLEGNQLVQRERVQGLRALQVQERELLTRLNEAEDELSRRYLTSRQQVIHEEEQAARSLQEARSEEHTVRRERDSRNHDRNELTAQVASLRVTLTSTLQEKHSASTSITRISGTT